MVLRSLTLLRRAGLPSPSPSGNPFCHPRFRPHSRYVAVFVRSLHYSNSPSKVSLDFGLDAHNTFGFEFLSLRVGGLGVRRRVKLGASVGVLRVWVFSNFVLEGVKPFEWSVWSVAVRVFRTRFLSPGEKTNEAIPCSAQSVWPSEEFPCKAQSSVKNHLLKANPSAMNSPAKQAQYGELFPVSKLILDTRYRCPTSSPYPTRDSPCCSA
ncbi:hypothetical protein Droror1_Dr00012218 [Drosera rotundifolia]